MSKPSVIVVGAGPAGLAAAWELATTGHKVTVLEADPQYVGGLARTMTCQGFRFDMGAHRFFSKNPDMTRWWRERLPDDFIHIKRLTRIHYRGRFFHYPLRAKEALFGLGLWTSATCLASYLWRRFWPIRPEKSFADWVTNRFGDRLYRVFFQTYTEKVWGMACSDISADWASQRIKGLSLWEAIYNAFQGKTPGQVTAKTLIDEFDYPRHGPGMLWEKTRDEIARKGGRVLMGRTVSRFEHDGSQITSVATESAAEGIEQWQADEYIVSMALRDCVLSMDAPLAEEVREAARQLSYRDFIVVALLVNRREVFPDNWIYVHSPEVKVGRIDNFNNWGQDMSPDPAVTCLAMEYFCFKTDGLWARSDPDIIALAKAELEQLRLANAREIKDACVVRVEKAYPVYDARYRENVNVIRKSLARIANLQMAGRNAMHKYNNQDHSMLTGFLAARNLAGGGYDLWRVNTDAEYLEVEKNEGGRLVPQRKA